MRTNCGHALWRVGARVKGNAIPPKQREYDFCRPKGTHTVETEPTTPCNDLPELMSFRMVGIWILPFALPGTECGTLIDQTTSPLLPTQCNSEYNFAISKQPHAGPHADLTDMHALLRRKCVLSW